MSLVRFGTRLHDGTESCVYVYADTRGPIVFYLRDGPSHVDDADAARGGPYSGAMSNSEFVHVVLRAIAQGFVGEEAVLAALAESKRKGGGG